MIGSEFRSKNDSFGSEVKGNGEIIYYYGKLSLTVTEVKFKNHLKRDDFPAASAICCLVTGTPSDTKNIYGVERNRINAHPVTTS
jgi:hypothetical protein